MRLYSLFFVLLISILLLMSTPANAQEPVSEPHYCFVRAEGRIDKRLSVEVDLGESDKADKLEDQIEKDCVAIVPMFRFCNIFLIWITSWSGLSTRFLSLHQEAEVKELAIF